MKRSFRVFLVFMLCLSMVLSPAAFAEEDLRAQLTAKDQQIAELQAQVASLETQVAELTALLTQEEATPEIPTLEIGSKGEAVVKLQTRLKDLGYLTGSADGAYGKGTAGAVSAFQTEAGIAATGTADPATWEALFDDNAPKAKVYVALDYKKNARDPDAYKGTMVKFSGEIIQVLEDGDTIVFRIATKRYSDDVVYCVYQKPENYKRFLEDDKVNVWGVSAGIYTYETIMGGTVTIPACKIDRIELQ